MAHFCLRGNTGAKYKYLGISIPGLGGPPLKVDEEMAEQIRALKDPMIMECDEACRPLPPKVEEKPKAEAKSKAKSKAKPKKKAEPEAPKEAEAPSE